VPQYYSSLLNSGPPWQTTTGTALTAVGPTTISPESASGTGNDPVNPTWWVGQTLRVEAQGVYTNGSTGTTATFALWENVGGTALSSGVTLATTGANVVLATSVTGLYWELTAKIQCRAYAQGTGTATLYTHGKLLIQTSAAGANAVWPLPAASGPTTANVDTTIAHTIGLVGTMSQVVGGPSITCTQFTIEYVQGL
jgi:hypothetical protein